MKLSRISLYLLIFMIPTIIGFTTNTDMHFSGLTSTTDGDNYISLMNQAKEGHILFTNMYTSEEVPYLNIRPTFMLAGWLSYITHLPNIFIYHLFRILGFLLFIFFLEKLLGLIFKNKEEKNTAIFMTLFASGIGFCFKILTIFGIKQYGSIDQWVTDANNFLILQSHPHTIFSIALMTATIYYFLKWYKTLKLKHLIISAIYTFILGFIHLFDVITLGLAIGFLLLDEIIIKKKIDFKKIKHLLLFGAIISIPFIYTYIMFNNPTYAAWNDQNVLKTPKFLHIIFGYGIMFFSFITYIIYILINNKNNNNYKKIKPEIKIILFWIISVLILIYSPFNIQRRFIEGAHIPFAIITTLFLFEILKPYIKIKTNKKIANLAIILIIIAMIPTNILHLFNSSININNERGTYPYDVNHYLYPEEHEALLWLKENSLPNSIIISTYNIGNHIPAYMNQRVYLGHWAQTIDLEKKKSDIDNYFKNQKEIELEKNTYIWYGIDEKKLNPEFKQPKDSELIFQNKKIIIYHKI